MPHVTLNCSRRQQWKYRARAGYKIAERRDFVRRKSRIGEISPIGLRARVENLAIRD